MKDTDSRWAEWGSVGELAFDLPARSHYVYVAWGTDSRPLYIGKSSNFFARMAQHAGYQLWYAETVRWELHVFETAALAAAAEIEAISALDPIHNVVRLPTPAEVKEAAERWQAGIAAKAAEANRKRLEREAVSAAWRARQAAKPPREPKPAREARVWTERPQSPWRRRRLRKAGEWPEYFTPDQLAIIRRVQNRGRAA